ncbi:MAG: PQQ-dependent sugar dehydrogenase [Chitinophagaceae bacterium]|nr:PQQ-dependent sugar dehydrogenase [Chitinophagaceae bacterium]
MHSPLKTLGFLLGLSLLTGIYCSKSNNNPAPVGQVPLRDSVVAGNLQFPWEILWGPDDHIWMTERGGRISRFDPQTGNRSTLITISDVVSNGEGGLLGMALHPSFSSTPYVYVIYNYMNGGNYREKLVRYTYNTSSQTLGSPATLLDDIAAASIHNGSRLLIVGDKLFISTGDASNTSLAQTISSPNGKILRLNLDGSIPADNPQPGNPYWSWGHRNPQGLVYANGRLYSSEHGPSSNDEINIIEKGRNYGWPNVEGFCDESSESSFCSSQQVAEPIIAWTPTIATAGLDYYQYDLIPQWKNSLLLATLKNQRLYQLKLNTTGNAIDSSATYLNGTYGRLRDICISPAGKVYVCTSNGGNNDVLVEVGPKKN